jgi:hypothetical protein
VSSLDPWSSAYGYGVASIFYPDQGLSSESPSKCRYTLLARPVTSTLTSLEEYINGWANRIQVSGYYLTGGTSDLPNFFMLNTAGQLLDFNELGVTQLSNGRNAAESRMYMQWDGNLCIYDTGTGSPTWCTSNYSKPLGDMDCRPDSDSPLANSYTVLLIGLDLWGGDYDHRPSPSPYHCGWQCAQSYPTCRHWTFVNGTCWLKNAWGGYIFVDPLFKTYSGMILKD